jgi:hypothetical protein
MSGCGGPGTRIAFPNGFFFAKLFCKYFPRYLTQVGPAGSSSTEALYPPDLIFIFGAIQK